jgi:hypothetical protein
MRQAVFVLFVLLFAGSLHADSRKQDPKTETDTTVDAIDHE